MLILLFPIISFHHIDYWALSAFNILILNCWIHIPHAKHKAKWQQMLTIWQKRRKWNERKKNGFYLWIESFHLELVFGFFFFLFWCQMKQNETEENKKDLREPMWKWTMDHESSCRYYYYYYYRSERIKLSQCCNFNFSSFIRRIGLLFLVFSSLQVSSCDKSYAFLQWF